MAKWAIKGKYYMEVFMNSRKLEITDGNFCYWCGKEMESHYDYSEREEWYTCGCDKAVEYGKLVNQLNDIKHKMNAIKQCPEAIEKFYGWKIDKLKSNMEFEKSRL